MQIYIRKPIRLIDDILCYAGEKNSDGISFGADLEVDLDSAEDDFILLFYKTSFLGIALCTR